MYNSPVKYTTPTNLNDFEIEWRQNTGQFIITRDSRNHVWWQQASNLNKLIKVPANTETAFAYINYIGARVCTKYLPIRTLDNILIIPVQYSQKP